jgi:hypothetical protein
MSVTQDDRDHGYPLSPEVLAERRRKMDLRKRFRFFLEHSGWATPPGRAACALESARDEQWLDALEDDGRASTTVEYDPEPWDEGTEISAEEATAKFQSGEWDGPYGVTVTCGDISASLWGIVVGPRGESDPYIRVVRAELAGDVRAQVETERLERERAANMDVATHPRVASPLEIEAGAATLAPCGHFHPIGGRR